LQLARDVRGLRVENDLGAEWLGELELLGMHIDGGDVHPHRLGVLNRHVAEAADPRDHHPFTRAYLRHEMAGADMSIARAGGSKSDARWIHCLAR
jgi:hypothetical protein